jgi:hypothetical protein
MPELDQFSDAVDGDVATILGIASSTIRAYVARGQMPAADSGPHAATICG